MASRPGTTAAAGTLRRLTMAGVVGGFVLAAFVVLRLNAVVIAEGELLYEGVILEQIRVFDAVDLYVEPGIGRYDAVAAIMLAVLAGVGLVAWLTTAAAGDGDPSRFFALCGAGALLAGLDEMLGLHETIGHNAQWLADLPLVARPDDIFMGLYVVAAALLFWRYRGTLSASRTARLLIGGGLAIFAAAGVMDLVVSYDIEEVVEMLGVAVLLAGFLVLVVERLAPASAVAARDEGGGEVVALPLPAPAAHERAASA